MSFSGVNYGDISPRIGLFAVANFLAHAQPQLLLERFAQVQAIPKNTGLLMKWRRSIPFDAAMEVLTEGITPAPMGITYEDVSTVISQYGSWIPFTDVNICVLAA